MGDGGPRYRLLPGHVVSRNDGDVHYVGAEALARLYGVDLRRCLVGPPRPGDLLDPPGLVVLAPRYDGRYALPSSG